MGVFYPLAGYNTRMEKLLIHTSLILTLSFALFLGVSTGSHSQVFARQTVINATPSAIATVSGALTATQSALTSPIPATPSALTTISDITQSPGPQKDKLQTYLEQTPVQPLSWYNPLEHAIRHAVSNGVPANIIVLVLLFPLTASIIAASRHIIGLRGFGIYIPAVLSVALVSIGIVEGLIIFIAIISAAILSKRLLKKLHLSYLPRTALLLWLISCGILAALLITPFLHIGDLKTLNIFPILILVLLSENFLDAQASTKETDALFLTLETIFLALLSGLVLRWEFIQKFALLQPELMILATAILDLAVGKFVGLRVSEWLRFRPIIEE